MSFLDNLFESAKKVLFKKDIDNLSESYQHLLGLLEAYPKTAKTQMHEDKFLESASDFVEWDTQLADLIVRRMRNQDVRKIQLDDQTRMMVVDESRRLYVWDVITQYIVELWTDYGFGQKPDIVPRSEQVRNMWNEFWEAPENQYIFNERKLNELSNKLQIDGEYWFVQFISEIDGTSILRIIETDDIKKIYYEQEDPAVPVYYKREWWSGQFGSEKHTLYYRDYRATESQVASVKEQIVDEDPNAEFAENKPDTDVQVFHVKFREIEGRGWPFLTAGFAWSRGYKGFLEDRATINKAAAAVVEKVKVQGGQRMVDAVKQRLQSSLVNGSNRVEKNPPPASGSIWVENQALDREWMSRPTNAADAEKDGVAMLAQVALSGKVYPHYLGRGEYYRLATATAMEGPTLKSFQRYQSFWSSVWRTLVHMVADAKLKYDPSVTQIDNYEVDVNTDRIIDTDVKEIDEIMLAINDGAEKGTVDLETAQRAQLSLIKMALQTVGTPNVVEVVGVVNEELEEALATGGFMEFARRIRGLVYGLWSGQLDNSGFVNSMQILMETGLRRAWRDGMSEVGLSWDDITTEEQIALNEIIAEQIEYIDNLADFVSKNKKESGGLLRSTDYRTELWANAYQQSYNKALQMANNDPKMEWILGATEKSCGDCLKYAGKVKRASYWHKIGAVPQSPALACKGINCDCELRPTNKPLSRGYLTPPKG
jgi:hypothetical protein